MKKSTKSTKSDTGKSAKSRTGGTARVDEPLDPSYPEQRGAGAPANNNKRACYAIKTLVDEVGDLFPEITHQLSNYDGRNTALDVSFDLTGLDQGEAEQAAELIKLTSSDHRVREVVAEEGQVLVSIKGQARTQDLRETFNLPDAWLILVDDTEGDVSQ